MSKTPRSYRVAGEVREVIAADLIHNMDSRLELVSITSVTISSDLREAKIFWAVHDSSAKKRQEVEEGLKANEKYFKQSMAKKLKLRFIPNLRFYYDDMLDTEQEVDRLMEKIAAKENHE